MHIAFGLPKAFEKAPTSGSGRYMTALFVAHEVEWSEIVDHCAFDAVDLLRYLL